MTTKKDILDFLEENEDIFNQAIEELDSWNGYLDCNRVYPMEDLDTLFGGISLTDFLEKIGNHFDIRDDYFVYGTCGIESQNYIDYLDFLDEYFVDNLIKYRNHLYLDNELEELLDAYENGEDDDEEDDELWWYYNYYRYNRECIKEY